MSAKLRVGLLMDSLDLWAWEWTMLKRIMESNYAELSLIVLSGKAGSLTRHHATLTTNSSLALHSPATWILQAIYRMLEAKTHCECDAFTVVDGRTLLSGLPILKITPVYAEQAAYCSADDLDRIGSFHLDVLFPLALRKVRGDIATAAKYGVWFFSTADYESEQGAPPGFWEVYFGWPTSAMVLRTLNKDSRPNRVLARSVSGTNRFSVKLNRSSVHWKTSSMLPRKLEQLHRVGERTFFDLVERKNGHSILGNHRSLGAPTNLQMALHIVRNVKHRVRELLLRKWTLPQWILSCHFGESLSTAVSQFQKIVPPKDRYWADPHVVQRRDKYYVFVEEHMFDSPKAHISVLEIDRCGRYNGSIKVLERDYHLSYPFILEHDGDLFMVPESSANRTIELYRCAEFPQKWTFVRNLMEDITAVDSTLLYHDGKWWLFANVIENPGASPSDELFLFHADSLLHGQWTAHPLNPIISDVTRSRPAGPILQIAGKLYRPAQDCSVRYGYAIRINHITALSEEDYAEHEVDEIKPGWDGSIVATHTLSYAAGLTVIDCLQPRFRIC